MYYILKTVIKSFLRCVLWERKLSVLDIKEKLIKIVF